MRSNGKKENKRELAALIREHLDIADEEGDDFLCSNQQYKSSLLERCCVIVSQAYQMLS